MFNDANPVFIANKYGHGAQFIFNAYTGFILIWFLIRVENACRIEEKTGWDQQT